MAEARRPENHKGGPVDLCKRVSVDRRRHRNRDRRQGGLAGREAWSRWKYLSGVEIRVRELCVEEKKKHKPEGGKHQNDASPSMYVPPRSKEGRRKMFRNGNPLYRQEGRETRVDVLWFVGIVCKNILCVSRSSASVKPLGRQKEWTHKASEHFFRC